MKATVEKLEKNKVKLEIEVDAKDFEKAMEKAYIKNRKRISIPGFRKGKAPRKIIERYYGESIFYEDAINEVCPEAYAQAVEETKIDPVDRPEIDILQIGGGQNLKFTAEVTVKPEVELGQYKGIEVEKVEYNVTDQDVDERLDQIRERNARWITVEGRGVKEGDRVTLDYEGFVDGEPLEGGKGENQTLDIGSGRFVPGFEDQLIGMEPDEEKNIQIVFPEDYSEELKGKEAEFKVKIHEIKEKELPELDDEFAKDVSEFDTLSEYRESIRKSMENSAQERAKAEMENQLLQKVSENSTVDIPYVMVESQLDLIVRDMDYRLRFQGMDLSRYLQMTGTSIEDFRAQYKDEAYNRVKTQLVLEKIAMVENIEATEEDLEQEFARLAEQYNRDVDEIKKEYKNHENSMKEDLVVRKTIDFLMGNAVFVEKKEKAEEEKAEEEVEETRE